VNRTFRTISIIARNELADSVRSRWFIAMVILYLIGAAVATALFIYILHILEIGLMETIRLSASQNAGGITSVLWKSDIFLKMLTEFLTGFFGDRKLAESLLAVPPLGLFYGLLAFAFTPVLVMLTSSTRIAEEVSTGSVRYVMFRAARSHWCIGKFVGQALQVLVALLLSAVGAWAVGMFCMHGFEPMATAGYMVLFALKAWIYALPFLGLALGVSQFCKSPILAVVFGFLSMVALLILHLVSKWLAGKGWRGLWDIVHVLTPCAHWRGLWWNDGAHVIPAVAFLLALAAGYCLAGYVWFSRRDL